MDYGNILTRSWYTIWNHKYLILLGVLVALGSGGGGGFNLGIPSNTGGETGNGGFQFDGAPPDFGQIGPLEGMAIGAIILLIGLGLLIGLAVWAVSRVAGGGLIAAVDTVDGGGLSSFGRAWQAGWAKGWRLIGIGLLPLIPVLILLFVGLLAAGIFAGLANIGEQLAVPAGAGVGTILVATACLMIPIAIVLNLLRTFADRACMLEDMAVLASYSRGWGVLSANLGPAVVLFVIQLALGFGLAVVLFLPGIIMLLCCILLPLFLLIQGAISAYFSTMWTLAWREWTGLGHPGDIAPGPATAR